MRQETGEVRKPDFQGPCEPCEDSGAVDMKTLAHLLTLMFKEVALSPFPG